MDLSADAVVRRVTVADPGPTVRYVGDGLLGLAGHCASTAVCAVDYGSWQLVTAFGERAIRIVAG